MSVVIIIVFAPFFSCLLALVQKATTIYMQFKKFIRCHCVHITAISGPFKWEKKESEESASSEGIEKKTTTAQPKSARAAAVCRLGVRPQ